MTKEYKTLRELNVQPGDVVRNNAARAEIIADTSGNECLMESGNTWMWENPMWLLVSRAADAPKLLCDMTDAEIGALVRAKNEGKVIECLDPVNQMQEWKEVFGPEWFSHLAYRVRPEPKREPVTYTWGGDVLAFSSLNMEGTHLITFDLIDGKPDCGSIKMEEL